MKVLMSCVLGCPPGLPYFLMGSVGPVLAGEGLALPILGISLTPDTNPWCFLRVIHLSLDQSIYYQKENQSILFLDSFAYEFHKNCRTTLIKQSL